MGDARKARGLMQLGTRRVVDTELENRLNGEFLKYGLREITAGVRKSLAVAIVQGVMAEYDKSMEIRSE